jgi:hypothetical protein
MPLLETNNNIATISGSSLHVLDEQEVYNPHSWKFNIYDWVPNCIKKEKLNFLLFQKLTTMKLCNYDFNKSRK